MCLCVLLGVVFDIFLAWVWSLLRVKEINISDFVSSLFLIVDGVLVDTNSSDNTGFQTIFHAAGVVGTHNALL